MALIETTSLFKRYATEGTETTALAGVSLAIESGEFVAIMGPSGSGKSTLLHILGFLDRPSRGSYRFDGREALEYSEAEMAHVRNEKMGFVFQSFNLLPRISVFDNVQLPLLYSNTPERLWHSRTIHAIEAVGLTHRMKHNSAQLSGGERQRVAIARALVNDPQVIFADEPTGNLDSKSGQAVMETIQQLNKAHGHTIILVTHESYTAETAKRIIKVKDGLIESDEAVRERHEAKDHFYK